MAPIMHQVALLMGWFYRENALGAGAEGGLLVQKQQQEKKANLETGGRRVPCGFSFLIAVCSLPRHVEVSGWITAMQEFMSVIFTGAIQARPGPIKHSQ